MKSLSIIGLSAIALGMFAGCSPPPRILTSQDFLGDTKVFDEIMQLSGTADPTTKQHLFNFSVRICTVEANATGSNCKDTPVLDNVNPRSIY
jgi:hypothetical protein